MAELQALQVMPDTKTAATSDGSDPEQPFPFDVEQFDVEQFDFHAKLLHDADEILLQTRSENYKAPSAAKDNDIWRRPPPDFRYIVYAPKPPKRNTVESQQPWLYGTIPGQRKSTNLRERSKPHTFRQRPLSPPHFVTRFHIARPFTAKKQFATEGKYPAGLYAMPQPHDFRQYPSIQSLGLVEFVTSYDRDPYNLHFNTKRLDTIHGGSLQKAVSASEQIKSGQQRVPPMSARPKWDPQLILKKTLWPQRSEAFSRHRPRYRNPYSAFMERVERDLRNKWSVEKQLFESCCKQTASLK